jgi:DnaJ-class molecular chaperone
MPHLGDPKTRGDLFALVRLVLPDPLTEQEVNSIRELASSRSNSAQSHPNEAMV